MNLEKKMIRRAPTRRQLTFFLGVMIFLQLITLLEIVIAPLRTTGAEAFLVLGGLVMLLLEVAEGGVTGAEPQAAEPPDDVHSKQYRLTPSRGVRMERSLRALIVVTAMAVSGGVMGTTMSYLAHQWAPMTAFLCFTLGMGFGLVRMMSAPVRIESEPLNVLDQREAWRIGRECLVRGLHRDEAFCLLEETFPHSAQISRYFDAGLSWKEFPEPPVQSPG